MPGLDPGIHSLDRGGDPLYERRRVDGRVKPGHDDEGVSLNEAKPNGKQKGRGRRRVPN
jgi:hypothetical protein